jgi:hypothetical protein
MPSNQMQAIMECGCCGGIYACCGGIAMPEILYADVVSAPKPEAAVYDCFRAYAVPLNSIGPNLPTYSHQWRGTVTVVDGCGRNRTVIIILSCVAGSEVDIGGGVVRGGFIATVEINALFQIPDRCITNFPELQATSCSPVMIGDDTWGDLGELGLNLGLGLCTWGAEECIECFGGISLRISE